jgi:hypothetical protein
VLIVSRRSIRVSVVAIGGLPSLLNPEIGLSNRLATPQKSIAVSHFPAPWSVCRFFSKGLNRHFAVLAADGPGSEAARPPGFTCVDSACPRPRATRQIGILATFFVDQWIVVGGDSPVAADRNWAGRRVRSDRSDRWDRSDRSDPAAGRTRLTIEDPPLADSPSRIRLWRTHHPRRAQLALRELPLMEAGRSARQVPHDGASGVRKKGSPAHWADRWRNRLGTRARQKTEVIGIDRWDSIWLFVSW